MYAHERTGVWRSCSRRHGRVAYVFEPGSTIISVDQHTPMPGPGRETKKQTCLGVVASSFPLRLSQGRHTSAWAGVVCSIPLYLCLSPSLSAGSQLAGSSCLVLFLVTFFSSQLSRYFLAVHLVRAERESARGTGKLPCVLERWKGVDRPKTPCSILRVVASWTIFLPQLSLVP